MSPAPPRDHWHAQALLAFLWLRWWCCLPALDSAASLICAIWLLSAWRRLSSIRWSCSIPCSSGSSRGAPEQTTGG